MAGMWSEAAETMDAGVTTIQDVNGLRQYVVEGIDDALNRPIISRFLTAEGKRVLQAQRDFWQQAGEAPLSQLLSLFQREP